MSLPDNYYERKAYCNAILFKVTVGFDSYIAAGGILFYKLNISGCNYCEVFLFRVVVEDSYCERFESYPERALLL